ncbi:armadillo repeat-containing protein 3 isoform X6 [Corvus cornix cornix]|uniref:armadillo repeat-containing protein 3 isoform X6 n=1 Tax=Corvus brachyrhynchos TaxID=85066 RepID=UPI0008163A82|nr:PREDICTED: armadillo repeat-containing protein 3 isoform X6 [Corvus brachyrhynchos]XP_019140884.1 armadillo repeat-containing protein 3 isoform X6 [Corvus cornix cornix]
MGKKVKKEAESPPKDVFDPLLIESKTPATAVLMLSSPENEVLAKACDALYKFASKGDENKLTLLGLGALEHLYKLLSHEDPIVRRNAVMVFGIMASNHDVKKLLRELDITNSLISQLAPEEDVVVHEFATLCLAHMAVEYTTKVKIFEQGGLEPLIRLLGSPDPDVKKNSVECLYLLVQDFQNRAAVRELNVIPPLLGLLESEYPVIQLLALQTLEVISKDRETRIILGENKGLDFLLNILENNELSDLHIEALAVLGNCLEDVHTLQLIQLTGGIKKLLSFLEISTVPGIQKNAAKAITKAAFDAEIRKILHWEEVEKFLLNLLETNNDEVKVAASQAISAMCGNIDSKSVLGLQGIPQLVQLLSSNNEEVKEAAVTALSNLTTASPRNASALDILEEINLSTKRKNKFSEAALEKLLDNNLSQKYSRMGYLSSSNIITNGFYDCGQIKHGKKFLSLEELSKQGLTDRRAIIFINAKPQENVVVEKAQDVSPSLSGTSSREKASSVVSPTEGKQELSGHISKSSTRGKGLRKGKGEKEEEKPKEVINITPQVQEEINVEHSHWLPPPDFILMDYINDASKTILPLTTTREQVVALAQFVADKMGGPVEIEKLHNFSWELQISEIEFELKCNIVPIGKIKRGTFYHRALLFKVIADRMGIGCSLVRGKYNRAWNEVKLVEDSPKGLLLPPQEYVVDLMFEPGCLMKQGTAKADQYKRI